MWTTFAANSAFKADSDSLSFHVYQVVEGELGTPRPYSVRHDDVLTLILTVCVILLLITIGSSLRSIKNQSKEFFFPSSADSYDLPTGITPLQFFLVTMTCVTLALCSFLYAVQLPGYFIIDSNIALLGIFFVVYVAYFLLKWLIYGMVNNVLFGSRKSLQWMHAFFFITALEGVLMFPLVLAIVYFGLSVENGLFYFAFVLLVTKILVFFKGQNIFFKQKILFLQNILYFCALEMTPLLAFGGAWLMLAHFLKVNF